MYSQIESRIQEALIALSERDRPNIAAAAREFRVPEQRLRARSIGCLSKQERPAANKKLSEDQELTVCQYLDRLDIASSSSREPVTLCESISGDGEVLPPMIILPGVLHLEQ